MGVALAAVSCLSVMLPFGQTVPQGPLARGLAGRSLPVGPAADPDAAH
jgi:hypothetical protein